MKIEEIIVVLAREAFEALIRAWFDQDSVKKGTRPRKPKSKSNQPPGKQ